RQTPGTPQTPRAPQNRQARRPPLWPPRLESVGCSRVRDRRTTSPAPRPTTLRDVALRHVGGEYLPSCRCAGAPRPSHPSATLESLGLGVGPSQRADLLGVPADHLPTR